MLCPTTRKSRTRRADGDFRSGVGFGACPLIAQDIAPSPSTFAAAPRSNSHVSLSNISRPFCADNAPIDLSFHPCIAAMGVALQDPAPDHRGDGPGEARNRGRVASQKLPVLLTSDHGVRDGPGPVQTSVLIRSMSRANRWVRDTLNSPAVGATRSRLSPTSRRTRSVQRWPACRSISIIRYACGARSGLN
jgi:hypothetical protein